MISAICLRKYMICFCLASSIFGCLLAQDSLQKGPNLTLSGFMDAYYSYDFSKPDNHEKAPFLFNHSRHNEFTVNLALLTTSYKDSTKRANIGLMAGTYPQYNLASEPKLLRHIYEANIGIKLSKNRNVWLDAGVLPSHIGFESAISKDCWTLTRSILAENSPYYEAGIRASYKTNTQKWYIAALLLNGWQRIKRVNGNNTPAFGTQLTFTPSEKLSINSSTFIGSDKPDSLRQWRYFNNLYSVFQVSDHWGLTMGIDIGFEQKRKRPSDLSTWYSPVFIVRYQDRTWAAAARAEYYQDKNGVIVPLDNNNPFQMQGYSLNLDRWLPNGILWRLEGRLLTNSTGYFNGQTLRRLNGFITTSISFNPSSIASGRQ